MESLRGLIGELEWSDFTLSYGPLARVTTVGSRQHGLAARWQIEACGRSTAGIARWVACGLLFRKQHGVYAIGHDDMSESRTWMAALLGAGRDATLTGRPAAEKLLLVKRPWSGAITPPEIVVPRTPGKCTSGHIWEAKTMLDCDWNVRDQLRIGSVPRVILDLGRTADETETAGAISEGLFHHRGTFSLSHVREILDRNPRHPGHHVVQMAVALIEKGNTGTASGLERLAFRHIREAGLPLPVLNFVMNINGLDWKLDFWWPEQRLCLETDGTAAHDRPNRRREDRIRDSVFRGQGIRVIRISEDEVRRHAERFVAHVSGALETPM